MNRPTGSTAEEFVSATNTSSLSRFFHNGDTSYYMGFGGLLGIDEGHVGATPGGVESHYDSFGQYNPLHWFLEALHSLLFNTRGGAAAIPHTCSVAGGCQ